MTDAPRITIVIPMKNEAASIGRCLEAVMRQAGAPTFEMVVIDSGSTDGSVEIARRHPVRLIEIPPERFNHGLTRQLGAEQGHGEFVVFLVADAEPVDEHWLANLVKPLLADKRVAGAYSRQEVRPGSDPIAAWHQRQWVVSDAESRVFGLDVNKSDEQEGSFGWFEGLAPDQRHRLANFDDVSSCIRRTALEQFPLREVPWAEDLDFSLRAIRAGWKIAYAADSAVWHTHATTAAYMFKRRWIDAKVIREHFGYVTTPSPASAVRQSLSLLSDHGGAILRSESSPLQKMKWMASNAPVSLAMAAGAWLGGRELSMKGIAWDALRDFKKGKMLEGSPSQVAPTVFTITGERFPTLMMHPNARMAWRMRLPDEAVLEAYVGIKPEAWKQVAPVTFRIELDDGTATDLLFEHVMNPRDSVEDREWGFFDLDLSPFGGQKVELILSTEASPSDYGWAGWGLPRIYSPEKGWRERAEDAVWQRLNRRLGRIAVRHV